MRRRAWILGLADRTAPAPTAPPAVASPAPSGPVLAPGSGPSPAPARPTGGATFVPEVAASLEVRVKQEGGTAVSGAEVRAWRDDDAWSGVTDKEGKVVLEKITSNHLQLRADAEGFVRG